MDKTVDVKANAIANATESPNYDSIYASSQAWWSEFWQKSYVYLPSQADFEQRRNYYMYLSAISNRGSLSPPSITAVSGLVKRIGGTRAAIIGTGIRIPCISL